jgi:hypothetical protein
VKGSSSGQLAAIRPIQQVRHEKQGDGSIGEQRRAQQRVQHSELIR